MDLTATIVPRSDQLNADDLMSGPRTVTITNVTAGTAEQPVNVHTAEFPDRPFKPSKSMIRVMVAAWGKESNAYTGRRMTLYRDPKVRWAGQPVGGIRISHMSDLTDGKPFEIALTETKQKRALCHIEPLRDTPTSKPATKSFAQQVTDAVAHYEAAFNVNQADLERLLGATTDKWTAADLTTLRGLSGQLKSGEKTVDDVFPQQPTLDGAA